MLWFSHLCDRFDIWSDWFCRSYPHYCCVIVILALAELGRQFWKNHLAPNFEPCDACNKRRILKEVRIQEGVDAYLCRRCCCDIIGPKGKRGEDLQPLFSEGVGTTHH
jgi:hypothetical protein